MNIIYRTKLIALILLLSVAKSHRRQKCGDILVMKYEYYKVQYDYLQKFLTSSLNICFDLKFQYFTSSKNT